MRTVEPRRSIPAVFEALEPRLLLASAPVVSASIDPVVVGEGSAPTVLDLFDHFLDPDITGVVYRFEGTMGSFDVHLFENEKPVTVANFRAYADGGAWANTFIHRSEPGFVVQGGGFAFYADSFWLVDQIDPIVNEPGISNTRGTIAMAKLGDNPDSATNQWFFNLADNSENLDDQNGGFTVFGEVLGSGMDIIDAIAALPTFDGSAIHPAFEAVPLRNYTGGSVQSENFALFYAISRIDELNFTVVANTNPDLIVMEFEGGQLTLTYAPNQFGDAEITLRATDLDGQTVESTFSVTVLAPPEVSIDDVSVTEGDSGTKTATFTLTLSFASENTVTVAYSTVNGTAIAGRDYTGAGGTVVFAPGQTTRTIAVAVLGDLVIEPDETFTVVLSSPNHTIIADGTGVCTIQNNDWADFTASINALTVPASVLPTDRKAGVIKKLPVLLTNTGQSAIIGTIPIHLYASANGTLDGGDTELATVMAVVKLAPGASKAYSFSRVIVPELPEGGYYLIADVDPDQNLPRLGAAAVRAVSSQTVEWLTPFRDLVGVIDSAALPATVRYGDAGIGLIKKLLVTVTNAGNVDAVGTIVIDLYASTDGILQQGQDAPLGSIEVAIKLRAGRSKRYCFSSVVVPNLTPGFYQLLANLDGEDALAEGDEDNNTVPSGSAVEWLAP